MERFDRNCMVVHLIAFPHQTCTVSSSPQQQEMLHIKWEHWRQITTDDLTDNPEGAESVQLCLES